MKKSILLTIMLPWLFLIFWHSANFGYPHSDEGGYFLNSYNIYQAFKTQGFAGLIKEAYWERQDKPVLHPLVGAAVLIFIKGNVLASIAITMTSFYLLLTIFIFLIFRRFLPVREARLATLTLSFLPWIIVNAYTFNAELPMMACMMGALYYLLCVYETNSLRHSLLFGFWLAMALCARPVESFLFFLIPVGALLFAGYKEKRFSWRDLAVIPVAICIFSAYFYWTVTGKNLVMNLPFAQVILLVALVFSPVVCLFFFRKKLKLNDRALYSLALCYIIVGVFYFPLTNSLYSWIYESSFGQAAVYIGNSKAIGYIEFIFNAFKNISGLPLMTLFLIGLFHKTSLPRKEFLIGLLACLFPFFIGGFTYNGDLRYYMGCGIVLYILTLIFALTPHGKFQRLRRISVFGVFLLLFSYVFIAAAFPNHIPLKLEKYAALWRIRRFNPITTLDPGASLVNELSKILSTEKKLNIEVIIYSQTFNFKNHSLNWTLDPGLLSIVAHEKGYSWFFSRRWPYGITTEEVQKNWPSFSSESDYILVGPMGGVADENVNPDSLYGKYIEKHHADENLEKINIKKTAILPFSDRDGYGASLLIVEHLK